MSSGPQDVVGDLTADIARRIAFPEHRVKFDGMEVDDLAGVASVLQSVGEPLKYAVARRVRVVVRVDRQYLMRPLRLFVSGLDQVPIRVRDLALRALQLQ